MRNLIDSDLLECAAIAAGITPGDQWKLKQYWEYEVDGFAWNPLTDDGDALRLAVKLRIKFRYNEALGQALAWTGGHPDFEARANIEDCGRDENACARRAIVRAAAEIGRQMQGGAA